MNKLVALIEKIAKAEAKNPVVVRAIHTAWEAAAGAALASLTATHGDIKIAVAVAAAAALAAVKNAVFGTISSPPAVDPTTAAVPAIDPIVLAAAVKDNLLSTPSQPTAPVEPPTAS